MRRGRELAAVTALVAALSLAGCGQEELLAASGEQQSGTSAQSGAANLDPDRLENVLSSVQETLNAGDTDMDANLLTERVADPALSMRRAQYALAAAKGSEITPLELTAQSVLVTNSDTWPRAIVDIAQAPAGSLPAVFFLTQPDARSDYKLVSWTRLLGGTSLTAASLDQGIPFVGADSTGFVMSPIQVVGTYVDMLNAGAVGDDHFTADEFAQTYVDSVTNLNDSVQVAGKVTAQAETPADDGPVPVGVQLQDGSALVSGSFSYSLTSARTVKDSTMKLGGAAAQLNEGDDSVVGTVTAHYLATVLFQIPDSATGGKVSVIGAETVITSVTRDDTKKPEGE